jgi:hypothetical protein
MADYTNSKFARGSVLPEDGIDAQEWSRVEPLLTPEQLRRRFLFGVPLVSATVDPITGVPDRLSDEDLKDIILRAVADVEFEGKFDIFPVKRSEKKPFDRNEVADLGYLRTNYRPILSVDKISVAPGNAPDIVTISPDWIDNGGFVRGEIHIIPTVGLLNSGYVPNATGEGGLFLAILGGRAWQPSFWKIEYTTGLSTDGRLPRVVNEIIGCVAGIEALSQLATTNRSNSHSLGMDGMSQSVNTGGPDVYKPRIDKLEERKEKLLKKARAMFGGRFALGNV